MSVYHYTNAANSQSEMRTDCTLLLNNKAYESTPLSRLNNLPNNYQDKILSSKSQEFMIDLDMANRFLTTLAQVNGVG